VIDFLGIGAQKAATTWLYEHLNAHPSIHFPGGKELHFWDMSAERGGEAWLGMFPQDERKQGEITPAYAILDPAIIRTIHSFAPEARLFFSLRDPVARAWSHALMELAREQRDIDDVPDVWFLDHFKTQASLMRGSYTACLDNWLAVYSSRQLHVIIFDDILDHPKETLIELADHLGVDGAFFARQSMAHLSRPVFAGGGHVLRPALRPFLKALYVREIEALSIRLGRDLTALWA